MATAVLNQSKRISITSKRQMTIPQVFFTALGFGNEAECMVQDDALVIRPVRNQSAGDFDAQILEDLINQGYSGTELLQEFKKAQANVRPAVAAMMSDAHKAALGEAEYYTAEDIF